MKVITKKENNRGGEKILSELSRLNFFKVMQLKGRSWLFK
jgi:hypothetical protein